MPYSNGQRPKSGDRVKRKDDGTFATVVAIELDRPEVGHDKITVKWDDYETSFTDQAESWTFISRG
jgi:hypothetical protein